MTDTFNGDNARLIESINALLELDAAGSLVPHGIGGHARQLLSAAAARLTASTASDKQDARVVSHYAVQGHYPSQRNSTLRVWKTWVDGIKTIEEARKTKVVGDRMVEDCRTAFDGFNAVRIVAVYVEVVQ